MPVLAFFRAQEFVSQSQKVPVTRTCCASGASNLNTKYFFEGAFFLVVAILSAIVFDLLGMIASEPILMHAELVPKIS
jgi:hypothetical protein